MERESFDFDTKRHLGLAKKTRTDAKDRDAIDNLSYAYGIEDVVKCLESYFKSSGILDLYKDMYIEITPFKSVSYNGYSLYLNPYGMRALIHEETPIRIHIVANEGYDQYIYYSNRKKEIVYFNSTVLSDKDLGNYIANRKMAEAWYEFPIIQDPNGSDPDSMSVKVIHKIGEFMKDAVIKRFGVNESDLGLAKKTRQQAEDKDAIENVSIIQFEDPEVEHICHEHGVYTYSDARNVSSIKGWFSDGEYWNVQSNITMFNEFKYFTRLNKVEKFVFYKCESFQSIIIPNSVTIIENDAFNGCENLQSINVPDSVTCIEDSAFWGCKSLRSINIPDSVTSIGNYAFCRCENLQSIVISKNCPVYNKIKEEYPNIQLVDPNVNESDLGLAKKTRQQAKDKDAVDSVNVIKFEDSEVERICHEHGVYTYEDASKVTSINNWFYGNFIDIDIKSIKTFSEFKYFVGLKTIHDSAFKFCTSLQSINIPDSVTTIELFAFSDCESLQSINIPDSVTWIESCAFNYCKSLKSINIPDSVTWIGENAFDECKSLKSIVISKNCPVYDKIKEEYPKIQLIDPSVNESNTNLGLAKKTRQQAEDKDTIDNVNFIHFEDPEVERVCHEHGVYTYEDARKVTNMHEWFIFNSKIETFDELKYFRNVQNLDATFKDCVNLIRVTIPGVAAATSHMFFNCSYLSIVTIEEGFSNFDAFMFYGCQRLKKITLPKSTLYIADKAFAYTNIVDLFIPDYIELMGSNSLIFMYYLKRVSLPCKDLLSGDQIAMFEIVRQNTVKSACTMFSYREKPTEVYESYSSLGLAKKARTIAGEKDEIDNVGIITPEDPVVAEILHRFNIRTYEDAARVTDINGWFKYKKMKKFNELKFFTGIKSTYGMFEGCEMLESVTIPMNVENIGDEAFFGCSALREVKIESKKIRSIGYKAFMDCTSLKHIDLPESLESISSCSFRRSGIESIDIPDRVYNIGDRAFSRCEDLLRVKLPRGLKSFGDTDHDVFQGTSPVEVVYDKGWYDIEVNRDIQTNLNNCCYQVKFYDGDK